MDEKAKTEARNYLSAAGFFLMGGYWFLYLLMNLDPSSTMIFISNNYVELTVGLGLFVVATLLTILRKRDMIAMLFFMMGTLEIFWAFVSLEDRLLWGAVFAGFALLTVLVTLTSKDAQKWLLLLIPLVFFIEQVTRIYVGYNPMAYIASRAVLIALCFYYAFTCASERINLLGFKFLTTNEQTDFKASGSVLGYMLFAITTGGYAFYYMFGAALFPLETFVAFELICDCLMVFVAILLFAVGKMRFTPVMFMLMAVLGLITVFSSGSMFVGIGILYVTLGLFALLRTEPRVLPGIMLIIYGASCFFTAYTDGAHYFTTGLSAVLNLVPCMIAIYLSFAVYSQRKLPLF